MYLYYFAHKLHFHPVLPGMGLKHERHLFMSAKPFRNQNLAQASVFAVCRLTVTHVVEFGSNL